MSAPRVGYPALAALGGSTSIGGTLTAIGPTIASLQDYTHWIDYSNYAMNAQQGAAQDTLQGDLRDPLSSFTITPEDDIIVVDASDVNGFPTVNLLANPGLEGTYSGSGVAPSWTCSAPAGLTASASATVKYGSEAQSIAITNIPNATTVNFQQTVTLPKDEFLNPIRALAYTFSAWIDVTSNFTGIGAASISIDCFNSANSYLSTIGGSTNLLSAFTTGTGGVYVREFISGVLPVATASVHVLIKFTSNSATNSGTVLIDGAQFEYNTFAASYVNYSQTATQAGMYPAPWAGPTAAGALLDGQTGLYYRHLRLFGGYVRTFDDDYSLGPERVRTIHAVDYGILLQEAPVTLTISQSQDSAAIAQAVAYVATQGNFLVGMDTTTYVASIATIDSFQINEQFLRDVLDHISNDTIAGYWVDYDKFLHYQPALAISAPFGFSSSPDMVATFPFSRFQYTTDSSQSITTKTVEGTTQVSSPQTSTLTGTSVTTTAARNSGTTYTSLAVTSTPRDLGAGWTLQIGTGGTTQTVTITTFTGAGATSIPVASFKANATYASTTAVAVNGYIINGGAPIYNVTSVTVGGTAQTVGIANSQSGGSFQVLYNLSSALVSFVTPPSNGANIIIIYTYEAPVLVRVHNAAAEALTGAIRRKIHHYQKYDHITSLQSAIDRATAELQANGKAKPIGTITCFSPPCPIGVPIRPGSAIQITHPSAGFVSTLFQVQSVKTIPLAAGGIQREIGLGYYQPDYILAVAHQRALQARANAATTTGSVLNDVQTAMDGWAVTDSASATVSNNAVYGTATYGGAFSYG